MRKKLIRQNESDFRITDKDLEHLNFQEKMEYLDQFAKFGEILIEGKENNWSDEKLNRELEPFLNYYELLRARILTIRQINKKST